MAIYTVHVPPGLVDAQVRAERTTFVADGFSTAAFLFGPLYFLRHRAYVAAVAWIVAVLAIAAANHRLAMPLPAEVALALVVMVFTGLEASSVRRFGLHRRGLDIAGLVSAPGLEAGETTFFRAAYAQENSLPPLSPGAARAMRAKPTGVIGLFPDAGT